MEKDLQTEGYETENILETKSKRSLKYICNTHKKEVKIGIIAIILIVAVFLVIFFPRIKFSHVENKAVDIAGMAGTGKGYFKLDTYPEYYENMNSSTVSYLIASTQENTLDAIKYANEALGFNGSLYSKMLETSSLMGRQTEENKRYKVSWTYHPDNGLEVIYEIK